MFGHRFNLFRVFGFQVRADLSWLVVVGLLTWTLAKGQFPGQLPDQPKDVYWMMGFAGAIALFASVLIHELAHALVAREFDLHMKGITLFIFGGVAEMEEEPPSAKSEFWVAVAGPIASLVLAIGLPQLLPIVGSESPAHPVIQYVGYMNWILVGFNLIPAFPLDGGRILRAILWNWKENLRWATRVTSAIGSGFGTVLIVLGLLRIFSGNVVGGLWGMMIGLFLREAASTAYSQLLMRRSLEGETVSRFMQTDPVTVSPDVGVREWVENYVYRHYHKFYPVVEDGRVAGCVSTTELKSLPEEEWDHHTVGDIMETCGDDNTITPDTDAMSALSRMRRTGKSRLLVMRDGKLAGVVTLKDLLEFLSLKVELEEEGGWKPEVVES